MKQKIINILLPLPFNQTFQYLCDEEEKVKYMFKREDNIYFNPDELIAIGAAIQVGVLAMVEDDVFFFDVYLA